MITKSLDVPQLIQEPRIHQTKSTTITFSLIYTDIYRQSPTPPPLPPLLTRPWSAGWWDIWGYLMNGTDTLNHSDVTGFIKQTKGVLFKQNQQHRTKMFTLREGHNFRWNAKIAVLNSQFPFSSESVITMMKMRKRARENVHVWHVETCFQVIKLINHFPGTLWTISLQKWSNNYTWWRLLHWLFGERKLTFIKAFLKWFTGNCQALCYQLWDHIIIFSFLCFLINH